MNTVLLFLSLFIAPKPVKTIYDFSFKTIEGKTIHLSKFKGKKILIINTASKCGFAKQYEDLEKLHQKYGKQVILIGFPSGNFGGQELTSNKEIQDYCKKNFGVTFILSEKSSVKGTDINPLFDYLTQVNNPDFTGEIKWNFEKFLIGEKGYLIHRYRSAVNPLDITITKDL